jgi:hypothetical protein
VYPRWRRCPQRVPVQHGLGSTQIGRSE